MSPILADCIRPLSCRVVVCPSDSFFSTHHRLLDSKIHVPAVFGYGWRVHLQAIEEKRVTSIHSGAFSANDEDSTNCLNRRTWYRLLMPACGRNARRVGNFCESKRQHVMRSMRAGVKYGRTVIRNHTSRPRPLELHSGKTLRIRGLQPWRRGYFPEQSLLGTCLCPSGKVR